MSLQLCYQLATKSTTIPQEQRDTPAAEARYFISALPKTGPNLNQFIEKYRRFRLEALRSNPGILAGSFKVEQDLPYSHFADLLTDPRAHIIVAVEVASAKSRSSSDEKLINGRWVGLAHIQGPIPLSKWTWPNIGDLRSDGEEARWHIFNGYIVPDHRSGGLSDEMEHVWSGTCLHESGRLLSSKITRSAGRKVSVRQKVCVSPKARSLVRWYKKGGWQKADYVKAEESFDAKKLGYEFSNEAYAHDQPDHLVMERIIRVEATSSGGDGDVKSIL